MKISMQANSSKKQATYWSRLGQELRLLFNGNVHYHVLIKSGVRLAQLWEMAEWETLFNRPYLIFILLSICDMTDQCFDANGNRFFWLPWNISARVNQVLSIMDDLAINAQLIGSYTKVCFLPVNGLDINKNNGISDPIPWRHLAVQHELVRGFIRLSARQELWINQWDCRHRVH